MLLAGELLNYFRLLLNNNIDIKAMPTIKKLKTGKWGKVEHDRFMKALQKHGKNWILIQKSVKSRTLAQVRSHAQKTFEMMPSEEFNRLQHSINRRHQYFCKQSTDKNCRSISTQKKSGNFGKKQRLDSRKVQQGKYQNPQRYQNIQMAQEQPRNSEQYQNKIRENYQGQSYIVSNPIVAPNNIVQDQAINNSSTIYNLQWVPIAYYYHGFNFQIQN